MVWYGAEIECRMQQLHPAIDGVRNRLPVPDRLVGGGLVMVFILMVEGEFGLSKFAIK